MASGPTQHQTPQEYQFPYPALDLHSNPVMIPPGPVPMFSQLVGVDGRYVGELRRFPGFIGDANWGAGAGEYAAVTWHKYLNPATNTTAAISANLVKATSQKGLSFFKYAAIQKDVKKDDTLRGWLTLGVINTGVNTDVLLYNYYDTESSAWRREVVMEFTNPNEQSIAGFVNYLEVSKDRVRGDPGMFCNQANTIFAGGTLQVWDSSTGLLNTQSVHASALYTDVSSPTWYPRWRSAANFPTNSDVGDHVRVLPQAVNRYVDYLDVAVHQRHFYVVGTKSDTNSANSFKIEAQVRCDSEQFHRVDTFGTSNTNTGPFLALGINSYTGRTYVDYWAGSWLTVNNGAALNHVRVTRYLPPYLSNSNSLSNYENLIAWEGTLNAAEIQGQDFGLQRPFWTSAPFRPGQWNDDTTKRGLAFPEADLQILSVDNSTHPRMGFVKAVNASNGTFSAGQSVTVALRFVAPDQNWYSSLTNLETVDINTGFVNATIKSENIGHLFGSATTTNTQEPILWPQKWSHYPTRRIVELWRSTVNAVVPGTSTPSGLMFRESQVDWNSTYIVEGDASRFVWGTKTDAELILAGDSIDQNEVAMLKKPPPSKFVEIYEDLLFVVSIPEDDDEAVDLDILRWSPTDKDRFNYLPVENRRIPVTLQSRILGLENTGQFLVVVLDNQILRIQRSGEVISVDVIHNQHGVVSPKGILAVGSTLYLVSQVGLLVVDLNTGDLQNYLSVEKKFTETWASSLSNVKMAYDAVMGCVAVLNPTAKEILLIWLSEGVATELALIPFTDCTTGPDPENGGPNRAWFYNGTTGRIYRMNSGDDSQENLYGNTGGTATANSNVSLKFTSTTIDFSDIGANPYNTSYLGFPVVAINTLDPTQTSYGYLTSRSSFSLTLSGGWSNGTPVNGTWGFVVAPVVYKVRLPQISGDAASPVLTLWDDKKVIAMAACLQNYTTNDGAPFNQLVYRVVDKDLSTVQAKNYTTMDTDPNAMWAEVPCRVQTGFPEIQQWASDCPFSLTAVLVDRTIENRTV